MLILVVRFLILLAIIYGIYQLFNYLLRPKRKLEIAHEQKKYFLLDELNNVKKNFFLTYKGVMFEGEKYLGTTEQSFEVISVFLRPLDISKLKGLSRDDFYFIESKIATHYPSAKIEWDSPIKDLLKKI